MKAPWPTHTGAVDAAAVTQFDQLKELVRGVRNARTEYGLEQARKVSRIPPMFLGYDIHICAILQCFYSTYEVRLSQSEI
jgi:hypothetical protein